MGRTVGKAHAEALVLAEAEAARVETGLVSVLWVEQDSVERALQVNGCEELGVANLGNDAFCAREGPAVLVGLGIDTPHVNAEAGVPIFLGHEERVGGPWGRARLGNVSSIVLADALAKQLLLMMGQAALALPVGHRQSSLVYMALLEGHDRQ